MGQHDAANRVRRELERELGARIRTRSCRTPRRPRDRQPTAQHGRTRLASGRQYCIQIALSSTVCAEICRPSITSATWSRTCTGSAAVRGRFGAGPFFAMEHIVFEEVTFRGSRRCTTTPRPSGRGGPISRRANSRSTMPIRPACAGIAVAPGGGVGHVAWLADSLEDEIARLAALGLAPFHAGRTGPASAVWFDGGGRCRTPDRGAAATRRDPRLLRDGAGGSGRLGPSRIAPHERAAGMNTRRGRRPRRRVRRRGRGCGDRSPRRRRIVAIAEKTTSGGGNCVYSGGFLFDVDGPKGRRASRRALLREDRPDRARGLRPRSRADVPGVHRRARRGLAARCDFEAFGGMLPSWPHFPAAGHVGYSQFVPGTGGAPARPVALLEAGVHERATSLSCSNTPVRRSRRRRRRLTGAIIEQRRARRRTIEARSGVVLASGASSPTPSCRDTYLPLPLSAVGHPGNTGDTLRLAHAGRRLALAHERVLRLAVVLHPDYPAAFTLDVHAPSFIYVDGDGRRFADETGWEVHDRVRSLTAYLPRRPNRPRMPGWIIFDEAARRAGPLHGIVGTPNDYLWSADNSAEVAAGWIAAR